MAVAGGWQDRLRRLVTVSLSDLNPFRGQESFVSIDIGSSSIKMIEGRSGAGRFELLKWGSLPTPPAAIQSNMVSEPDRVAEVVRALLESKGVRARKAITAVPGPAVIIKRVNLPAQSPQEIENTILFEAGNFIPEDLDNVNLDYQITAQLEESKQVEVMLVAAKKDIVSSYSDTLRLAGLIPVVVDVDYFALDNMYELNYDPVPDQVVALVNIGGRYSSINILKGGRSTFTGDVPVGGRDISEALTRDLSVSPEEAEQLKLGTAKRGADTEQVATALGPAIDALIEEIHYALSFFWTAATDERIDALYVSGGAARMPELCQRLGERVEARVEMVNPVARVSIGPGADGVTLRQRAAEFAVAMGLAIRRPEDK